MLSKSDIRRNPDSEEHEEMSRQHERDVFAAKMQYKFDNKLPPFDEDMDDDVPAPPDPETNQFTKAALGDPELQEAKMSIIQSAEEEDDE